MRRGSRAVLIGIALQAGTAAAEVNLGAGIEYFDWREDTVPEVKETGPLLSLHASARQDKSEGVLFGGKARIWMGSVDYDGTALFNPSQRLTGNTNYYGFSGAAQLRYRYPTGGQNLDLMLALGLDSWRRELSSVQAENYSVWSAILGFELEPAQRDRGLLAGLGVKYPFHVREVAELSSTQDITLKPKGEVSLTAHLGFALDRHWRLIGYYETVWLKQSNAVLADFGPPIGIASVFQPSSTMDAFGLRLEYRF